MTYGVFITGTDTGVGKTRVGTLLASLLLERGIRVRARKPVESGCKPASEGLIPLDALALRDGAGCSEPLEDICRFRFEAAVSPERAALLEGTILDLATLYRACMSQVDAGDFLLVEGAGGFYSPIARGALNADLAGALGLPVVIVAADRLGAISQTLLAVEAAQMRGLAIAGIVLNQTEEGIDPSMKNSRDLERWLKFPVTRLPYRRHCAPPLMQERMALSRLIDGWLSGSASPMPRVRL